MKLVLNSMKFYFYSNNGIVTKQLYSGKKKLLIWDMRKKPCENQNQKGSYSHLDDPGNYK